MCIRDRGLRARRRFGLGTSWGTGRDRTRVGGAVWRGGIRESLEPNWARRRMVRAASSRPPRTIGVVSTRGFVR
eukprot:177254-Pyramimonas_sp.AAC.1